nr:CAPRDM4 [Biomphalaria glabrata]
MADSFPTISADQLTKAAAGVLSALDGDAPGDGWQTKDIFNTEKLRQKKPFQSSLELLENLSTSVTSELAKLNQLDVQKSSNSNLPNSNPSVGKIKKYDGSCQPAAKKYSSRKNYKLLPPIIPRQFQKSHRKHAPQVVCQKQVVTLSHQPSLHSSEKLKSMPIRFARYTTNYVFIRTAPPVSGTVLSSGSVSVGTTVQAVATLESPNHVKSATTINPIVSSSMATPSTAVVSSSCGVNAKSMSLVPIAPKLTPNNANLATVIISSTGKSVVQTSTLRPVLLPISIKSGEALQNNSALALSKCLAVEHTNICTPTKMPSQEVSTSKAQVVHMQLSPSNPGLTRLLFSGSPSNTVTKSDAENISTPSHSNHQTATTSSISKSDLTLMSCLNINNISHSNSITSAARGSSQVKLSPSSYHHSPSHTTPGGSTITSPPSSLRILLQSKPLSHTSSLSHIKASPLPITDPSAQDLKLKSLEANLSCVKSPSTCNESKLFELTSKSKSPLNDSNYCCSESSKFENFKPASTMPSSHSISTTIVMDNSPLGSFLSNGKFIKTTATASVTTAELNSHQSVCKSVTISTAKLPGLLNNAITSKSHQTESNPTTSFSTGPANLSSSSVDQQFEQVKESLINLLKSSSNSIYNCPVTAISKPLPLMANLPVDEYKYCNEKHHQNIVATTSTPSKSLSTVKTMTTRAETTQSNNLLKSLLCASEGKSKTSDHTVTTVTTSSVVTTGLTNVSNTTSTEVLDNHSTSLTNILSREEESMSISTAAAAAAMVSLSETNTLPKPTENHPALSTDTPADSSTNIASSSLPELPQFHISPVDRSQLLISPAGIKHLQNLLRKQGISEGYFIITTPRPSLSAAANCKNQPVNFENSNFTNTRSKKVISQTGNSNISSSSSQSISNDENMYPSQQVLVENRMEENNGGDLLDKGNSVDKRGNGESSSDISKEVSLCQDNYESESDSSSESQSSCGALVIETGEDEDGQQSSLSPEDGECSLRKHLSDTNENIFDNSHIKTKHVSKLDGSWEGGNDLNGSGIIAQSPLSLSDLIRQQQRHGETDYNFLSTSEHKMKNGEDEMRSASENIHHETSVGNGDDFNFTIPLCPVSAYGVSHQNSALEISSGYQHNMYGANTMFTNDMSFENSTQHSSLETHNQMGEIRTNPSPKLLSRPMSAASPKSPLSVNSSQIPDHSTPLNPPMTPNTMLINLLNRVPTPLLTNHHDLLSVPTSQENNMNVSALGNFEILQSKQDHSLYHNKNMTYSGNSNQNSLLNNVETDNTNLLYNQDSRNISDRKFVQNALQIMNANYSSMPSSSDDHGAPLASFSDVAFSQHRSQDQHSSMCFPETYEGDVKQHEDSQHFHCKSCPGPLVVTVNLDTSSPAVKVSHACNAGKSAEELLSTFEHTTLGLLKTEGSQESMQLNLIPVKSSETDILRHLILNTSSGSFHSMASGDQGFVEAPSAYNMSQPHMQPQYECQVESFLDSRSQHKDMTENTSYQSQEDNFLHLESHSHSQSASSYTDASFQVSTSYNGTEEDNPTLVDSARSSYILQGNGPSFTMNDMNKSNLPLDDQPFLESSERLQHLSDFRSDQQQENLFYQHTHDPQTDLHQQQDLHLYDPDHQHQDHELDYHLESLPQSHESHQYSSSLPLPSASRIFEDHPENVGFIDNQFSSQYYDNSRMATNLTMFSQLCAVASEAPVLGTSASHSCNIPFSTAPTGLQFQYPPDDEDDASIVKQPVLPSASFSPPSVADPAVTPDPGGMGMYNGTFPNLSVYDMYVRGGNSDVRCGDNDTTQELGNFCVDCNIMYKLQCKFHPSEYSYICDTPILSHARLTLPSCLRLGSSSVVGHTNNTGVFAKEVIAARTKFGPLIGSPVSCDQLGSTRSFSLWQTFSESSTKVVDTSDENSSNWLMFIKPACVSAEQNLVAFQHGSNVYFVTRMDINPGQELRYWFAKDYARLLGITPNPKSVYYQLCPHCTVCKQIFPDRKQVRSHTRLQHPKPCTKKCGQCSRRFSQVSHLNAHITSVHLKVKKCVCPHCDKRFSDSSNFRKHVKSHSDERYFKCQICGKDFRQKAHLTHHMNTHMPVKNEQCGFCGVRFTRAFSRKQHELQHTKQNKFPCAHCNKVFYKKQVYRQHLKIHSNERNHVCPLCNKAFRTKANLTRHGPACKQKKNIMHSMSSQSTMSADFLHPGHPDISPSQFRSSSELMSENI